MPLKHYQFYTQTVYISSVHHFLGENTGMEFSCKRNSVFFKRKLLSFKWHPRQPFFIASCRASTESWFSSPPTTKFLGVLRTWPKICIHQPNPLNPFRQPLHINSAKYPSWLCGTCLPYSSAYENYLLHKTKEMHMFCNLPKPSTRGWCLLRQPNHTRLSGKSKPTSIHYLVSDTAKNCCRANVSGLWSQQLTAKLTP